MTKPMTKPVLDACQKIGEWQRRISPPAYDHHKTDPERTKLQQELIRAVWNGPSELLMKVVLQQSCAPGKALDGLRPVPRSLTAEQFATRDWHGDNDIHSAVAASGATRVQTMEYKWWHLFTLRLLADGRLPNPPRFFLAKMNPPFRQDLLDRSLLDAEARPKIEKDAHYRLDIAVRTYLRNAGGIHHRVSYGIRDAPLRRGWWIVELAKQAGELGVIETRDIYEALCSGWSRWAGLAAFSTTRLAHRNCVAAYAMAALEHKRARGNWPTGDAADTIASNLMRRTINVAVNLVDPHVLATMASASLPQLEAPPEKPNFRERFIKRRQDS